jgi:oligosaccharide repeat unit polymerase
VTESIYVLVVGFSGVAMLLLLLSSIAGAVPIHALVYSAVWLPCLCISQVAMDGAIRPAASTTMVLFASWWAFLIGSILPLVAGRVRNAGRPQPIARLPALAVLYGLLALQWAGAVYEIMHFESAGRSLGLSTLIDDLASLRVTGETAEIHLPPFLSTFRWAHVIYLPLALILLRSRLISRWHFLGICLLAAAAALLHFTRAPVVQLSIVAFVAWMSLYKPSRKTFWIASACVFGALLAAFVAAQIAINQQSSTRASLGQSLSAYFGMSPLAYEDILQGGFPREPGYYSLDSVYFFLNKAGLAVTYPGLSRPQIWFPEVTNVYTYLDVFTLDAGVTGAILGACLVGVGCSWVYRENRRRTSLWTLSMYAYVSYCCLMTPINNEFIRANTLLTLLISWLATRATGLREAPPLAEGPGAGTPAPPGSA